MSAHTILWPNRHKNIRSANRSEAVSNTVWRMQHWSVRISTRTVGACAGLLIVLVALGLWSIAAGDFPLALGRVALTLLGQGEGSENFIVFGLRLPRLLTGIMVGVAFGMAGAIFQSLMRNPLASPDVIGFDSGAALGAVSLVILAGATGTLVAVGAIGGGIVTALAVFALSWKGGGLAPIRVVLVGIGLSFFTYAGVEFMMTRSDIFEAAAAQAWLTGSLNARLWSHVWIMALGLAILVPLGLALQIVLDRLELGDDLAAALGIRVEPMRIALGTIGVLFAALAVASAGPLPFVAFVSGPLARRISGSASVSLVTAALVGAVVVTAADLAGRLAFAPTQLPVGVFTALVGAPYLLWLLATQMRKGAM